MSTETELTTTPRQHPRQSRALKKRHAQAVARGAAWVLLSAVISLMTQSVIAQTTQSLKSIKEAAYEFAVAQLGEPDDSLRIKVGKLDARLRLAACDRPLETYLPPSGKIHRNGVVGVRCSGGNAWSLYVPVEVRRYGEVVVTARALARGETLSAADIKRDRREISSLTRGFIADTTHALGRRTKRHLAVNTLLTPQMLLIPKLVKRGQRVTLLARSGGIEVRMPGSAMSDGGNGDIIRVRNLNSKKIVEGTISSDGIVEISL